MPRNHFSLNVRFYGFARTTPNTVYLQKTLDSLAPQPPADLLAHPDVPYLSPARFHHINPYGKFRFALPNQSLHLGFRPLNIL